MKRLFCILIIAVITVAFGICACAETADEGLAKGSKGEAVVELQNRLKELGYYSSSVDGDYGNGTANSVSAFQSRNGIEATGDADAATLALLYSDDAKKAPVEVKVYPSNVKLSAEKLSYNIVNKTDDTVDSVWCVYVLYGEDNSIVTSQSFSDINNYLTQCWGVSNAIKSGRSLNLHYDNLKTAASIAKKAAIAVTGYHTASGNTVYIDPDQLTFYYSDGTTQLPESDIEPYTVPDEELIKLNSMSIGYNASTLFPWAADLYSTVEGSYLQEIYTGTLADKAGLQTGDIITAIDGESAIKEKSTHMAQQKLLDGGQVEITYIRNGATSTVTISSDMEAVAEPEESTDTSETIGQELLRYGELLEKGLISQEEYDVLKEKLIYG